MFLYYFKTIYGWGRSMPFQTAVHALRLIDDQHRPGRAVQIDRRLTPGFLAVPVWTTYIEG